MGWLEPAQSRDPVCYRCEYSLKHLPSDYCPECGADIHCMAPCAVRLSWEMREEGKAPARLAMTIVQSWIHFRNYLEKVSSRNNAPVFQESRLLLWMTVLIIAAPLMIAFIHWFISPMTHFGLFRTDIWIRYWQISARRILGEVPRFFLTGAMECTSLYVFSTCLWLAVRTELRRNLWTIAIAPLFIALSCYHEFVLQPFPMLIGISNNAFLSAWAHFAVWLERVVLIIPLYVVLRVVGHWTVLKSMLGGIFFVVLYSIYRSLLLYVIAWAQMQRF